MSDSKQIAFQEVETLLQEEIKELHPGHRLLFQKMRIPFKTVPVDAHPGEYVIVVAEYEGKMLYYSEIEEGWELEEPTSRGGITEREANQFELTHIMWQLFGDPDHLK